MAGLVASSLIGLVYLTLPALAVFSTFAKRRKIRITSIGRVSLAVLAVALALLAIGEVAGSFLLLAVASSTIVLTCIIAVPTIAALAVLRAKPQ
jgi:succinate-acetate transporter protein